MSGPRRVGLFGGAFDPPHLAHVALARAAVDQLELERLVVCPTGHAWHKARALSPATHRVEMARLAFATVGGAEVDTREIERAGPTYTVDTLRELQQRHPQAQLMLVIGGDQALALHSWHQPEEIARLAIICVAERRDSVPASGSSGPENAPWACWRRIELPDMPISATDIRRRVAAGQGIDHLVPAPVARYIDRHHLYRPT